MQSSVLFVASIVAPPSTETSKWSNTLPVAVNELKMSTLGGNFKPKNFFWSIGVLLVLSEQINEDCSKFYQNKNESNCVQEETFKSTTSTKWIGEHVPIRV